MTAELETRNGTLIPARLSLASVAHSGRGCWLEIYGSGGSLILGSDNQKDYVHGFSLRLNQNGEPSLNVEADQDLRFTTSWIDGRVAPVARIHSWWADSTLTGCPMIPGLAEGCRSQQACDEALRTRNLNF